MVELCLILVAIHIALVMAWQIRNQLGLSSMDFAVEVVLSLERIEQPIAVEAWVIVASVESFIVRHSFIESRITIAP